jgi:hypothetical protein
MNFQNTLNLFKVTKGSCVDMGDPCPHSTCRYHVHNSAKDCQIDRSALTRTTCSLKLAERGGMGLEEIGNVMGITRERVRQIELNALTKLKRGLEKKGLLDDVEEIFYHLANRGA